MSYRRLRKKYMHRFGTTTYITLHDKAGKVMHSASKKATAFLLKECLRRGCDSLHLLVTELKAAKAKGKQE